MSKVRLFNDGFVYNIPLNLQVFLLGRKWENVVKMYISSSRVENIFLVSSLMADTTMKRLLAAI